MGSMIKVAFSILKTHWKAVLLMVLFFATNVFGVLLLRGYLVSTKAKYQTINWDYLIIHESDTYAEFYGSRISPKVGETLKQLGYSYVVPALHTATGTAGRDFQFVLGVDVLQYRNVERFEMLSGHELTPADPDRSAMVGRLVAERDGVRPGDTIRLRGRDFNVIGIFETHGFYDNDVWISLQDAQNLLGWGTDVSYYIVPDEDILIAGDAFIENTVISHRGETLYSVTKMYVDSMDLYSFIVSIMGIATAISLGNVIFRLVTLEKYHLAILRSVGFSRMHISLAILIQTFVIFLAGFGLGLIGALIFPHFYQVTTVDLIIEPDLGLSNIIKPFFILGGTAFVSIVIPLIWVYRSNVSSLLRSE